MAGNLLVPKEKIMTTQQIANRLVELCRKGDFEKAQKELFSDDAKSVEPVASAGFDKETKGLKAIIEKGHQFQKMVKEIHGITISDPVVAGNAFAVTLEMDTTMNEGKRSKMAEVCVYEVKEGKIVLEQFFM
jgi:hypothetical protein